MKNLLTLLALSLTVFSFAQNPLSIERIVGNNPSPEINNAEATLMVTGGVEPYFYYWSNPNTDTNSRFTNGLTEGITYTVTVRDAAGNE